MLLAAAMLLTAPNFAKTGDVIKKADPKGTGVSTVQNPKKQIFARLMPLRRTPDGNSPAPPQEQQDIPLAGILPKETQVPKRP